MARFHAQMIFEFQTNRGGTGKGNRVAGWTESVYITDDLGDIFTPTYLLASARCALLSAGGSVVGLRFQRIDPIGPTKIDGFSCNGNQRIACDIPQMAARAIFYAGSGTYQRPWLFPGLPDDYVKEGERDPNAPIQQDLIAFKNLLTGRYTFKARRNDIGLFKVVDIDADGHVRTTADTGFQIGDAVQVLRANTPEGRRVGGFADIVARTDGSHFQIFPWEEPVTKGGKIRLAQTVYPAFGNAAPNLRFITTRKVGRPPFLYRGKATTRR